MEKIVVDNLTKDYGHGRGVFDVSFKVNEGEVFGFLGPNGAGKSTTIRHLMGFSKPDNGQTKILGEESFGSYEKFMAKVGYLPGEIALPSGLSGWQFIEMMKKLKKADNDKWIGHLLNLFQLDPVGETKRMSLGDKRKLAIVTAFLNDPDVLILDEPTSGLDLEMQQTFIEFIKNEKARGKTILLSSHIFSEVEATCDRIAIIKEGKIVSEFLASDFKHNNDKIYQITFKNNRDKMLFVSALTDKENLKILGEEINSLTISVNDRNINELIQVIASYKISDFVQIKESLEEYFMKYYKKDGGGL